MDIKSKNPVVAALTKKIPPNSKHGVPAFVILLALTVGLVYYRHRHAGSPTAATSAANVSDTSGSDTTAPFYGYGGSSDTGGGGGGGDNSGNTQPAQAPVSWDPAQFAAAVAADLPPQEQTPSNDPAIDPTNSTVTITDPITGKTRTKPSQPFSPSTSPDSVYQAGGPGGSHLVQPLKWGGQTFYTQADFDIWARKHGSSVKSELKNHPEATTLYNNLGSNDLAAATVPSPAAQKASGRSTSNVSSAPAPAPKAAPAPAPATKAPAPAPVQIRTKVGGTATPLPSTNKRLGKI